MPDAKTRKRAQWAVVRDATEDPQVPIAIGMTKPVALSLGQEMGYDVVRDVGQFEDAHSPELVAFVIRRLALHQRHKQAKHAAAPWKRR